MKKFQSQFFKFLIIGLVPFLLLIFGYLAFDPFKVIYHYSDFSYPYVIPNRDYISTKIFSMNRHRYNYNSFIFGSSRTVAFQPSAWKNHLSETDTPYLFDASGESINGIHLKIKYLDSINVRLENVLILMDRDATFYTRKNNTSHLFIQHPLVTGESWFTFHLTFLKAYLAPEFFLSYYLYKFSNSYFKWMEDYIEKRKIVYDTVSNELKILDQEKEIHTHPDKYYEKRSKLFYERSETEQIDTTQRIIPSYMRKLIEIRSIFD